MAVRAFYSDHFVLPLPEGHKFPMAKYSGLRERVLADGILAPGDLHEAPAASWDDLRLVHDARYVDAGQTADLRAFLRASDRALTETWTFPWKAE